MTFHEGLFIRITWPQSSKKLWRSCLARNKNKQKHKLSIDAQKRLQRNTKDLFRIYGYPRNPDHFVFLFPFPSLLNIPISEIFIVFGNEHLTNCLKGVVISEKSLSGNIWLMIWLRVGRTTSRGRTRGNLQGPTTSSFVSTTSSLLASWSVTFDYITIMVRMMANVGRITGAGSKDIGSQKST